MPHDTKRPATSDPTALPPYVEGGFINDQSGRATEAERQRLKTAPRVDPIEAGISRISRLTEAAGFGLLTVRDIERILARVEPPRAMPGVRKVAQEPRALSGEFPTADIVDAMLSGHGQSLGLPSAIDVDPLSVTGRRLGVERERVERELNRRGFQTNSYNGIIESLGALA